MTRMAFFDAPAGIAGDMLLGAWIDAGWPEERLRGVAEALGLLRVRVRVSKVQRHALGATKVDVLYDGEVAEGAAGEVGKKPSHGRGLEGIVRQIRGASSLPEAARERAVRVFEKLAEAEARVHGVPISHVHFHEVGGADALVDIVGTSLALTDLGIDEVCAGPLPVGEGTVETAHGTLPLPAPAVLQLLIGHPVFPSGERYEQVTPTGAAIVKTFATSHVLPAGFVPSALGTGAGTYEGGRLPNVVRVLIGETVSEETPTDAVLLETNLDDVTGQEVARAIDAALGAGALDAWAVATTMKKGRPGLVLSVLAEARDVERMEHVIFRETPTLGIRRRGVERTVLARHHVAVETSWGKVRMKVRQTPGGEAATPEHDDALAIAKEQGISLREVLAAARRAYERQSPA